MRSREAHWVRSLLQSALRTIASSAFFKASTVQRLAFTHEDETVHLFSADRSVSLTFQLDASVVYYYFKVTTILSDSYFFSLKGIT